MNFVVTPCGKRINLDLVHAYELSEHDGKPSIQLRIEGMGLQLPFNDEKEREVYLSFLDGVALWRQPFSLDPSVYDPNTPNMRYLLQPGDNPTGGCAGHE